MIFRFLAALLLIVIPVTAQSPGDDDAYLKKKKRIAVTGGSGGSFNIGDQFRTAGDDNALLPIGIPFVTPATGTYTATGACTPYVGDTASHTVDCGLYSSSSGAPNTLLCHVSRTGTWAGGFQSTGNLSGCGTLSANTLYFVGEISSSGLAGTEEGTSPGTCPGGFNGGSPLNGVFGTAQGSAVLPSSWGTNHTVTKCWSGYVVLTCVAACGAKVDEFFLIDFNAGTNGNAPTTTTLGNSTKSAAGGIVWTAAAAARETFATAGQQSLLNSYSINGNTESGGDTLGLAYATGVASNNATFNLPGSDGSTIGLNNVTIAWKFKTSLPQNDTNGNAYSMHIIYGPSGGTYCVPQILPSGSALAIQLETSTGSTGSIAISTNTVYTIQLNRVTNGTNTTCNMAIYDSGGTQVGSNVSLAITGSSANKPAVIVAVGISGAESESSGSNIWTDSITGSVYGTFPIPN